MTQQPPSTEVDLSRFGGRVITNLIKLGGLVLVFNEVLIRPDIRPGTLAIAAFMMAGANGLETLLDRVLK